MENEPQNSESQNQQPAVEPNAKPAEGQLSAEVPQHSMRNVFLGVSLVLILVATAGLWYWFAVYQKQTPVVQVQKTPIVKEDAKDLGKQIYFSTALTPTGQGSENYSTTITLFRYDGTTAKPKQITENNLKLSGTIFGATTSALYFDSASNSGSTIAEYNLSTKQTKILATSKSGRFNIARPSLSPDKSKLLYSEVCVTECGNNIDGSYSIVKVYNFKDGSINTLLEQRTPETIFTSVGEKWVTNDLVLLSGYCECDGIPPLKEMSLINVNTGVRTTVALESDLLVRTISISPDGKSIAYLALKLKNENESETTYTNYIKLKNILTGEVKTLNTSSNDFADQIYWRGNDALVFSSHQTTTVAAGPGGYYANGGTHSINAMSINSPADIQTILSDESQYGNSQVVYIDQDIVVLSENLSTSGNGTYLEKYTHYVYNFKTKTKEVIAKDTIRWNFLK